MSGLSQFQKDVDAAYEKKVVQTFHEFHRAVALDAFRKVSADTRETGLDYGSPVWSGGFRSSHHLSLDAPEYVPHEVNPEVEEGLRWPDEPDRILGPKPMSGIAQKLLRLRVFGQVFITNTSPQSRRLEGGYSQLKAPEGVYKVTAIAVIEKFKAGAFRIARGIL